MVEDWNDRQLCEDGACTGVIGDDGTCRVCGKAAVGFAERAIAHEASGPAEDVEEHGEASEDGVEDIPDGDDPDWANRELCSDGACTGVIRDDGTCSVCGKAAA